MSKCCCIGGIRIEPMSQAELAEFWEKAEMLGLILVFRGFWDDTMEVIKDHNENCIGRRKE